MYIYVCTYLSNITIYESIAPVTMSRNCPYGARTGCFRIHTVRANIHIVRGPYGPTTGPWTFLIPFGARNARKRNVCM